jgi:hypothetical protein
MLIDRDCKQFKGIFTRQLREGLLVVLILLTCTSFAIAQKVPDNDAPKSESSATLEETLAWLKEKLTTYASITFDFKSPKGRDLFDVFSFEPLLFNGCNLSWKIKNQTNAPGILVIPGTTKETSLQLSDVDPTQLKIYESETLGAKTWKLDLKTLPDKPKIKQQDIVIRYGNEVHAEAREIETFTFRFQDKDIVPRIAKAFEHSIQLCNARKEPF